MTRSARPRVLVVGGGTVGHLAPGFALAERLVEEDVEVVFATPGDARERAWFPPHLPAPLRAPAPRLPRRRAEWPLFPARLLAATASTLALVRRTGPGVVVGLGGWPCVPAVLAGRVAGLPVCLIASDATPGVAVRRLAPLAERVYVAQAGAAARLGGAGRVVHTGPVLRAEIRRAVRDPAAFGLEADRWTLLVTGGSLGASALNGGLARGIRDAVRADPELGERLQVLHSVGASGAGVEAAYVEAGIPHRVVPFLRSMGRAYRTADLVVCRAGALTCAELAAAGTPAVLVPYPHHTDRQQYANAGPLVDRGAAVLLEESALDATSIRDRILGLLADGERLSSMARAMEATDADGAGQIALDLVRLLKESGRWTRTPGER